MRVQRQSNGQVITLDAEIGGGGEGKIYTVSHDRALVAKVYHQANLDSAHKLAVMFANPPEDPTVQQGHVSIAWPVDLLRTDRGQIVGFLMPRVSQVRPIHEFYTPKSRRQHCPFFNYLYLHRTARNLAAAVSALHNRGYVIGDVNESNILVSRTAMVTLVDTDSFQVRDRKNQSIYYCPVGKPEFTPPEMQGKAFRKLDRTPQQDRFGLAVLIFQLLMEGTHPFAGVYSGRDDPPPIEGRIAAGHFPYGTRRVPYRPMPVAPKFELLSPQLQRLFVRCFEDGHTDPDARPDARTWVQALEEAEQSLVMCATNPQHRYGYHLHSCPWCDRAGQLNGRDPFPSPQQLQRMLQHDRHSRRTPTQRRSPLPRQYTPQPTAAIAMSVPGVNVPRFWAEVAKCKTDLLVGSLVLAMTLPLTQLLLATSRPDPAAIEPFMTDTIDGLEVLDAGSTPLRLEARRYGHNSQINSITVSPDGKTLASSDEEGKIKIWSLPESVLQQTLSSGDRASQRAIAFGANGRTLASGTDNEIRVLQVDTGRLLKTVKTPLTQVRAIQAYGKPAGDRLLVSGKNQGKAAVLDLSNGQLLYSVSPQNDNMAIASPDGKTLVTVGDTVQIWDLKTQKLRHQLDLDRHSSNTQPVSDRAEANSGAITVAFSPDSKLLATTTGTDSGSIQLWKLDSGKLVHTETAGHVTAIAFSPDGKTLVAGGSYGMLRVWDVQL